MSHSIILGLPFVEFFLLALRAPRGEPGRFFSFFFSLESPFSQFFKPILLSTFFSCFYRRFFVDMMSSPQP